MVNSGYPSAGMISVTDELQRTNNKPSQRDPAAAIEDGEPAGDRHFPGESRGCGLRHGHSRRRERAADPTGIDDGSARAPIGQAAARQRS